MLRPDEVVWGRATGFAGGLALACLCALPLAAQVTQKPVTRPPVTQPRPEMKMPQAPAGDLVITGVTVTQDGTGAIVALVNMKNVGSVVVEIPRGTVIARGESAAGTVSFPAQKAEEGFAVHPGTAFQVRLPSSGWCPAGQPGPVTFRANPDNALPESDRSNNTFALAASAIGGDIHSGAVWLESQRFPPVGITGRIEPAMRNTLPRGAQADLILEFANGGPGYVVVCEGVALLRDVQSPMSAAYGLKTYKAPVGFVVRPGSSTTLKLQSAIGAVVLAPGTYAWQFLLNPDAAIPDSNAGNNAVTTSVKVIDLP